MKPSVVCFKDAAKNSVELTLTERIWNMILEIVREIAECFNIEDEQIFDMLVNRSDKLSHFVEIYQLKQASQELAKPELNDRIPQGDYIRLPESKSKQDSFRQAMSRALPT